MGAPAEGNLHLASVWPMGLRLGSVSPYQLVAGTVVGMKLLTLIFVLTLTAFILNRGNCICETVTAPVTFTNKWINILPSFSKLENGLQFIFGGPGQQGLQ